MDKNIVVLHLSQTAIWSRHPSIRYLKVIYDIIHKHWSVMDEGTYVYDDEYNHRGIFNGTKYRELDNDEQLLDQQFKLNPNPFGSK